jgi:hypothetical protein
MADAIQEIDTSVLDDLVSIRHEQAQLVRFRARAEEMKVRVDARVYERVVGDYDHREATLLERAAPLEARARVEFRKLRARYDEVTQTRTTAEFDKAEIEFRHSVGEIDDAELAERVTTPEAVLAQCQQELEALDALKARFVEAYEDVEAASAGPEVPAETPPAVQAAAAAPEPDVEPEPEVEPEAEPEAEAAAVEPPSAQASEAEEAAPPEEAPAVELPPLPPVVEAVAEEAEAAPDEEPAGNVVSLVRPEPAAGVPEPPPLALHHAPTQMYEVPGELLPRPPEPERPHARHEADADADADATFILPDAVLVDAAHGATEFRLGAMNYIGRADDNQIRLKSGDISRRHAMISVANGAYLLRDLQSQNGTFVNGHRITEHVLADGDRVRVGNIELVFHYASSRLDTGPGIAWAAPGS